ncbi:MAG: PilX N-terminal domain-containing pilus assembly protein [Gammaproteobacteria bacterium]
MNTFKNSNKPYPASNRNNKGAVMIMSLSILLILTMLSVSSMNISLFEERMASNVQSKSITFQATESAINTSIANKPLLDAAVLAPINTISDTSVYAKPTFGNNVDSSVAVIRKTECKKQLLQGFSYRFGAVCGLELDGISSIGGTGAKTNNIQGLAYIVPKQQQHQ